MEKVFKTREQLEADGWKFITGFGCGLVFGKEGKKILWVPKTGEIILEYGK